MSNPTSFRAWKVNCYPCQRWAGRGVARARCWNAQGPAKAEEELLRGAVVQLGEPPGPGSGETRVQASPAPPFISHSLLSSRPRRQVGGDELAVNSGWLRVLRHSERCASAGWRDTFLWELDGSTSAGLPLDNAVLAHLVEQGFVADIEEPRCLLAAPVRLLQRTPDGFHLGFVF